MQYFLLCPRKDLTNLIYYALAHTAKKYAIEVHALCVMSDHYHTVVTDTQGVLPKFLQEFHRLVAMGVKHIHHWEHQVWDSDATSEVALELDAVIEKIAYVMANPVAAGAVERAELWPGAKILLADLGRGSIEATRPNFYFSSKNPQWEEKITLPITLPPMIAQEDGAKFRGMVGAELASLEVKAHAKIRRQGRRFLGAARAMQISPMDRAKTPRPKGKLNPMFAVGRGNAEALEACIAVYRAFLKQYYEALEKWRAGDRDAVFPAGTWWMRVFHKAKTADMA